MWFCCVCVDRLLLVAGSFILSVCRRFVSCLKLPLLPQQKRGFFSRNSTNLNTRFRFVLSINPVFPGVVVRHPSTFSVVREYEMEFVAPSSPKTGCDSRFAGIFV